MAGVWVAQNYTFRTFYENLQTLADTWNLNPPHQRGVVHGDKWMSDIICSGVVFRDIPSPEFHTRGRVQESLDGKQRIMAIVRFFEDEYALDGVFPEMPQSMDGRTYSQLDADDKRRVDTAPIIIKIYSGEMTKKQISRFFYHRQKCQNTTFGEFINSQVHLDSRDVMKSILQTPTTIPLLDSVAKDTRHFHMEMIVRFAYFYVNRSVSAVDPGSDKIQRWWSENDPLVLHDDDDENVANNKIRDIPHFTEAIEDTCNILVDHKIPSKHHSSHQTSYFVFILHHPDWLEVLRGALDVKGPVSFPPVSGRHDTLATRYPLVCKHVGIMAYA